MATLVNGRLKVIVQGKKKKKSESMSQIAVNDGLWHHVSTETLLIICFILPGCSFELSVAIFELKSLKAIVRQFNSHAVRF